MRSVEGNIDSAAQASQPSSRLTFAACVGLLSCLLASLVWSFPPDVNEAHYLLKARHFWDNSFCAADLFAQSGEAHWLYYLTHGWLFQFFEFPTVAWIGRIVGWMVLASGLLLLFRVFEKRWHFATFLAAAAVVTNEWFQLAGEWFVGGTEGKGLAYGFIFAGLACWFTQKRPLALMFLGFACAFHVVVGLWSCIAFSLAAAMVWRHQAGSVKYSIQFWALGSLGFFAGLATGVLPGLALTAGVESETVLQAARLQSLDRLAHHQFAAQFTRWHRFLPIVTLWIVLVSANRSLVKTESVRVGGAIRFLNAFTFAACLISVAGIGCSYLATANVGWIADLATRLLTLYMFRLADVFVPVALVINLHLLIQRMPDHLDIKTIWAASCYLLVSWAILLNGLQNFKDPRSPSAVQAEDQTTTDANRKRALEYERNWIRVCHWIRDNTPPDAVFLTPTRNQTFKWYAHRSEFFSWKDMPQDVASVIQWAERRQAFYVHGFQSNDTTASSTNLQWPFPATWAMEIGPLYLGDRLAARAKQHDIDYLLVPKLHLDWVLKNYEFSSQLKQVYPIAENRNSTFVLYAIR